MATIKDVTIRFKGEDGDLKEVTTTFDKINTASKKSKNQVKEDLSSVNKSAKSLGNEIKKLGVQLVAAFSIKAIVTSAIRTITAFDNSIKQLQSILGVTTKELEFFKDAALEIGRVTKTSAKDVVEAFKLVGSARPELLKNKIALAEVTEQTLILAKAAGVDASTAALSLTGALNAFGASSADAAKFTDILATSQQRGSSTVADTADALKNAGSAAKAAGLSFEETNVAIQALSAGNIKGAEAGTKLRAILVRLASNTDESINPTFTSFSEIVDNLSKRNLSLTDATKLFGQETAAAAIALINQNQIVKELTGNLNEQGNALAQATINSSSLSAQADSVAKSWERFILQLDKGEGPLSKTISTLLTFVEDVFEQGRLDERLGELGLSRGLFQDMTEFEKRIISFDENLKEQRKTLALNNATTEEYDKEILRLTGHLNSLNTETEEGRAASIVFREAIENLKEDQAGLTEVVREDTVVTEENTVAKTKQKSAVSELNKEIKSLKDSLVEQALAGNINNKTVGEFIDLQQKLKDANDSLNTSIEVQTSLREGLKGISTDELGLLEETEEKIDLVGTTRVGAQESILQSEREIADARRAIADELFSAISANSEKSKALAIASLVGQKAIGIADVIINTQRANAGLLLPPPFGLGPFAGPPAILANNVRAALSIASIVGTAIPQFAEGTKDAPGGLSLVGERGPELMMMPKGSKVLPDDKTSKHSRAIDAMFDNRFEDFVKQEYLPELMVNIPKVKRTSLSESIANAMNIRTAVGLNDRNIVNSLEKARKGTKISNAKEIAKALSSEMSDKNFERNNSW